MSELTDALAKAAPRVCSHMNRDHPDSVLAYAHHYAELRTAASATMVGLTPEGFELRVQLADGSERDVLVRYHLPLESAAQLHKLAVSMHFEAFHQLGVAYKLRHRYYLRAARQVWTARAPRTCLVAAGLAALAAGLARVQGYV